MFCGFVPPLLGCDGDVTIAMPGFCFEVHNVQWDEHV